MFEIKPAYDHEEAVKELFAEYMRMLIENEPDFAQYLVLQNYDAELADLDQKYGLPDGRLYIALDGEEAAGCIGLRRLDGENCELKRLYVRPAYRGCGLAKAFVERILADAGAIGYRAIYLDTLPMLTKAIDIYKRYGFREIGRYNDSPIDTTIFMKREL